MSQRDYPDVPAYAVARVLFLEVVRVRGTAPRFGVMPNVIFELDNDLTPTPTEVSSNS